MYRLPMLLILAILLALTGCQGTGGGKGDVSKPAAEPPPVSASGAGSDEDENEKGDQASMKAATLLYQGHGSLRIATPEGKVIYIDPYVGDGYDAPADLILVTHAHYDHTQTDLIENMAPDCQTITYKEALAGGEHKTFDLGFVTVEAVEAGYNKNHDVKECVGYILTFSDGKSVYVSGDTSTTKQMPSLAERNLDYAFFCCDGVYNMDVAEASACAALVQARHSIPYHMIPGELFSREIAEQFVAEGRLIVAAGEEITLS